MSVESLWSNKLRTGLTMLGMIIGISSVVAITSVGQGVQKATEKQIQSLGSDVLLVLAGASSTGGVSQGQGSASTLTLQDAEAAAKQVTAARAVTAFLQRGNQQIVYGGQNIATAVVGTDLNYPDVKDAFPVEGQFFTQTDLDAANAVVVLGSKVRDQLFGEGKPAIGAFIRIQKQTYRIIGVMGPKGAVGNTDQDDRVFIPLSNMSSRLVGNNSISGVSISGFWAAAKDNTQMDAVQFQVTNLLRLRHNIYPPQLDDFRIINQVDIANTYTSVVSMFTVMIVAIAGISLVVGGIGIANIMLVSVVERTREIGIRKAMGATNSNILSQFLTEAVLVSTAGGTIGILLGMGIAVGAAQAMKTPLVISPLSIAAGAGISVTVGLVAGVVPARNAARLDPITALRSE
ncbi:MAG: FtsX-like permease family protein [Calothrix sp. SM1_7_51]|nr:FtsX-like permease family protein [Calothrix sp. SM1_7_51]